MTSFAGIRRHCSCCHFWLYFDENRHFWRPRRPRSNTRATSLQASRRHRVQRRFRHRRVGWRRWNCWVLVRPYVYTNVSSSHIRLRYHFKEKPTDVLACQSPLHWNIQLQVWVEGRLWVSWKEADVQLEDGFWLVRVREAQDARFVVGSFAGRENVRGHLERQKDKGLQVYLW